MSSSNSSLDISHTSRKFAARVGTHQRPVAHGHTLLLQRQLSECVIGYWVDSASKEGANSVTVMTVLPRLKALYSIHQLHRRMRTSEWTLVDDTTLALWMLLPQHAFSTGINAALAAETC